MAYIDRKLIAVIGATGQPEWYVPCKPAANSRYAL
jgi:hypothetical protein